MKTTETTRNITLDTAAIHTCGCVDFRALAKAYLYSEKFTYDIEEIFACVCKTAYWVKIRDYQRRGVRDGFDQFYQRNRDQCLERPSLVEYNIAKNATRVIRKTCLLSTHVALAGLPRILTRRFETTEGEGKTRVYSLYDALTVSEDIMWAYEQNLGKSLLEKHWGKDMKRVNQAE